MESVFPPAPETEQNTQEQTTPETTEKDLHIGHENALKSLATIFLVCGCFGAIAVWIEVSELSDNSFLGFLAGLLSLFSSIALYAAMNVLSNISITLKEIQAKDSEKS